MIKVKTYSNTILVTFNTCNRLSRAHSFEFKTELLKKLTYPFSNIIVDFNQVKEIDIDTIDALLMGQRLSEINKGQVSLFNVKEKVLKSFKSANVDHLFFFCDRPKPFSENVLMI